MKRDTAVLARIERIRPNADGSGKLTYRGPCHLFDGDDYWNNAGTIIAWCGARAATVDLHGIEDRHGQKSALFSDLCGRCFIQPRNKKAESSTFENDIALAEGHAAHFRLVKPSTTTVERTWGCSECGFTVGHPSSGMSNTQVKLAHAAHIRNNPEVGRDG